MTDGAASADECLRLAALEASGILDTPRDRRFDELAALAADIAGVSMAAISFIDGDRQWIKAAHGLTLRQCARGEGPCAHLVAADAPLLVVPDAAADPRFRHLPLVAGPPWVRFYAGVPVRDDAGWALGALAVMDDRPRTLGDATTGRLVRLGQQAGALLDLHRKTDLLQTASMQDALTGLANRPRFEALLADAVAGALAGRPCGLILLDLDHFAEINGTLGPDSGDSVLREVARRLHDCVRGTDILGRLGGDEFAVLVSGPVEGRQVRHIAARIDAALSEPHTVDGRTVALTASLGVVGVPQHGVDAPAVLRAAWQALRAAKRAGGRRAGPHDATVGVSAALESDLRAALRAGDLHLHWQPICCAGDGKRVGYEALLRWDRAGHGAVPPAAFIPVAEATGLIGELDAWVLRRACEEASAWPPGLYASVNMSAYWFGRGDLVRLLRGVLARSGLPPDRLTLELTERTLVQHTDAALRTLHRLRAMGVRLALDDFGIGYSSFGYLRQFAFDALKLDRDFVSSLGRDRSGEPIVRAIVELGHAMGMQVCAEGVETEAQLARLRALRCDLVQGYLLGRPGNLRLGATPAAVGHGGDGTGQGRVSGADGPS
ncbi:putative bifunctional diguanylate cyclase/phosphodiesterase, partial [Acidisphaera rubrifaciens]|uniref:putative bifunctional diguanylate cyclase/phosphodiesterase n=1 Tax=Acidisphaera rubrifaciens TaxID=50715 RepID=UPI0006625F23